MDNHRPMNTKRNPHGRSRRAFTLIEMLTVITIMGILATLIVTMGQAAAQKKKTTAVNGEKHRLTVMIDAYYNKLNYYPPDNGALVFNTTYPAIYDALAATNPLIYELTGATNVTGARAKMLVFNSTNTSVTLFTSTYSNVFNRGGIANGDSTEPHDFFLPGPSAKEYTNYFTSPPQPPVCGLVVPVEFTNALAPNFWHYDYSTTNRHNLATYDLWAEFQIGSKSGRPVLITNGNW